MGRWSYMNDGHQGLYVEEGGLLEGRMITAEMDPGFRGLRQSGMRPADLRRRVINLWLR